jgi:hypothetical protein
MSKNRPPKYLTRNQRSSHKNPNVYQNRKKTCEQLRSKSKPLWQVNFDKRMDEVETEREKREEDITLTAKNFRKGKEELKAKLKKVEKIHFHSPNSTIH